MLSGLWEINREIGWQRGNAYAFWSRCIASCVSFQWLACCLDGYWVVTENMWAFLRESCEWKHQGLWKFCWSHERVFPFSPASGSRGTRTKLALGLLKMLCYSSYSTFPGKGAKKKRSCTWWWWWRFCDPRSSLLSLLCPVVLPFLLVAFLAASRAQNSVKHCSPLYVSTPNVQHYHCRTRSKCFVQFRVMKLTKQI